MRWRGVGGCTRALRSHEMGLKGTHVRDFRKWGPERHATDRGSWMTVKSFPYPFFLTGGHECLDRTPQQHPRVPF